MKNYLLKVENVLKSLNHTFLDDLTQYQGSNGHSATSDVPPWARAVLQAQGACNQWQDSAKTCLCSSPLAALDASLGP